MTTPTAIDSSSNKLAPEQYDDTTLVSVNDLIIGKRIHFPLYDVNGVLLLAADSNITAEIKQAVRNRGETTVRVANDDVRRITIASQGDGQNHSLSLDCEMFRKLDAIIDGGLLTLKNKGEPVKETIKPIGRKAYDPEQRARLFESHQQNGLALGEMLAGVLRGQASDSATLSAVTSHYLHEMTIDSDNVLSSAISQFSEGDFVAHALETALLAMAIGIELGLDAENVRHLGMAGLVHDWGMMRVPAHIRENPDRLDSVAMLEIKKHPIHSLQLQEKISNLPRVVTIAAYQAHERMNGTGYPRGRSGESIHLFARILQVADAFVGMTSRRPYRPAMMRYAAMECLIRQAKERYVDGKVVRCLLKIQSLFPIGSYVSLSDGSVAVVIRRNKDLYTQPIVARIQDADGNTVDQEADENIIDLHEAEDLTVSQALPMPGSDEIEFGLDYYNSSLDKDLEE
ncbi:HD-GYP domain-containing protein [Rubinisphaera margarita]|uniref:HD-GYP domain-containing protein n=1 Tax=Rubinisphaera margarita TaxID=2909586 RepID=UPI001EE7AF4C|nr:HD domain-containing phosphohydrolase [Rubinisphaera margarita]MCG6158452.1 HD domain-containing protein [Rubinisphaera margarita]